MQCFTDVVVAELKDLHSVDPRHEIRSAISALEIESVISDQLYLALVEVSELLDHIISTDSSLYAKTSAAINAYQLARTIHIRH